MSPKNLRTMTMKEFFRCTLPVISEHPEPEYAPYSFGGTSFLVEYQGVLCVLTAQHVIDNLHPDPHRIRVLAEQGGERFLPLAGIARSNIPESYADISMIEVNQAELTAETRARLHPVNLNELNRTNNFHPSVSVLCLRGYPRCLSNIDFSEETMRFCGYYTETRYIGYSTVEHCHVLNFIDLSGVESINGLSGSPVLHVIKTGPNSLLYDFAGMLIMGTKESLIGHFIDSSMIYAALDWLVSNKTLRANGDAAAAAPSP